MNKRALVIVLDSVGIGELPDAALFGDEGSNTLGNIAEKMDLKLPNLEQMGLGNIKSLKGIETVNNPTASFGKANSKSNGKDTTTGHWELTGCISDIRFEAYEEGFPQVFIEAFEERTGYRVLCNKPYSGTEVIKDYGFESIETKSLIVYTSADPVLQIAMHEEAMDPKVLYQICKEALELSKIHCPVARVIARPFIGNSPEEFKRTVNRKDFSIKPPQTTVLDSLVNAGHSVYGIGKISDIFDGQGISKSTGSNQNNLDGIEKIRQALKTENNGFIFANLVDFDSVFGHRRNVSGYGEALMEFDKELPSILDLLNPNDLLIITADHGCDPTFKGSDHTREYIPILAYSQSMKNKGNLGVRDSFADIGATVQEFLMDEKARVGESFLSELTEN